MSYEEYIELMKQVYPNSTRKLLSSGKNIGDVWVDTEKSWSELNGYEKQREMDSLRDQLEAGIRRLKDTINDNYKIRRK